MSKPELAAAADGLALVAAELRGMGPRFRLSAGDACVAEWGPPSLAARFREVMHAAARSSESIAADIESLAAEYRRAQDVPEGEA